MAPLEGRTVIVTGGAGSIGRAHCLLFAEAGALVLVNDLGVADVADGRRASADAVVAEIRALGGDAVASTADASSFAGAAQIVGQAMDEFGSVDALVNNATVFAVNDVWRFTEEEYDRTFDVNMRGYYALIREAAPHMCRQGRGAIVNTSSGSGFGHPSNSIYAAAKEGLVGLTRSVARELGRFGVRCNAIRPNATTYSAMNWYVESTERWAELMAATMGPRGTGTRNPAPVDPDARAAWKISPFVVWLCTDAADHVNGRTFHISGDFVSLLSEPVPERSIYQAGGWDLEALGVAAAQLTDSLRNDYLLEDRPHLKVFPEDA